MMKNNTLCETQTYLDICVASQQLTVYKDGNSIRQYPISTAKNGLGELRGSQCTPRGWHQIRAKIGAEQPLNTVFIGRRPTGEIYTPELGQQYPKRDWILTRILWLGGIEPHKNRYGSVDTTWRYIYVHGCPDELMTGMPESHGCIRIKSLDLIELYDTVNVGHKVFIHD